MRHLFLKLKVTEWKGDKKDITIKTEMLQKKFPIKKKTVKLLQAQEENCNNEHPVSVAHKKVVGPHRTPHIVSLYGSWRLTILFW